MLDQYIGECMVSIININDGIKEPTWEYQICNTSQKLIFGGYVKVRESFYTQVIIWVDTILNHIDTTVILPRYECSCIVYRPEWHWKQKQRQKPIPIPVKKYEILIIDNPKWYKRDNTSSTLV